MGAQLVLRTPGTLDLHRVARRHSPRLHSTPSVGRTQLLGDGAPRAATSIVDLETFMGADARELRDRLLAAESPQTRFSILEDFVAAQSLTEIPRFVRDSVARIESSHGSLRVADPHRELDVRENTSRCPSPAASASRRNRTRKSSASCGRSSGSATRWTSTGRASPPSRDTRINHIWCETFVASARRARPNISESSRPVGTRCSRRLGNKSSRRDHNNDD